MPILSTHTDRINMNVLEETVEYMVGNYEQASISLIPDNSGHTTYRAKVMYKNSPSDDWRELPSAVLLSSANSASGKIDISGYYMLGVRVTTVNSSTCYGTISASFGFKRGE